MPALQKWEMLSAVDRRMDRKAAKAAEERQAYAEVDKRDQGLCRVCGKRATPKHHHHLVFRSKGGLNVSANIVTLDAGCHNRAHKHEIHLSGDANWRDPQTKKLAGVKVEERREHGFEVIGWV